MKAGHDYFSPRSDGPLLRRLRRAALDVASGFPDLGQNRRNDGEFCMTVLALRLAAAQQRRQQIAWRSQPADVAIDCGRMFRRRNSHRPCHQWRPFPQLDLAGNEPALRPLPGTEMARRAGQRGSLERAHIHSGRRVVANPRAPARTSSSPGRERVRDQLAYAGARRKRRSKLRTRCSIPMR